jgi:hypothetical protein
VSKRIRVVAGGLVAAAGAVATLSILVVAGIRIGDRAINKYTLEPFSRAEQQCEFAGRAGRSKCLRAEFAKMKEPVWNGTLPHFLTALLASAATFGGLVMVVKGMRPEGAHPR